MPAAYPEDEKTDRVALRLPMTSLAELDELASRSGVTRGQFLGLSLMIGARALDRALNPGQMMTPSIIEQMTASMLENMQKLSPEVLKKMFEAVDVDS